MEKPDFMDFFKGRETFEKRTDELDIEINDINNKLKEKLYELFNEIHKYLKHIIGLGIKVKAVLDLKDLGVMSEEILTLDNLNKYTGCFWIYGPKDVSQLRNYISFGSLNNVMIKFLIYDPGESEEG